MTYTIQYKLDDRDPEWKTEGTYTEYEKAKQDAVALVFDGYIIKITEE